MCTVITAQAGQQHPASIKSSYIFNKRCSQTVYDCKHKQNAPFSTVEKLISYLRALSGGVLSRPNYHPSGH